MSRTIALPELWHIKDLAQYLKLSTRAAARLNIPYARIGGRRVYTKENVLDYILESTQ